MRVARRPSSPRGPAAAKPRKRWAIAVVVGATVGLGVLVLGTLAVPVGLVLLGMLAREPGRTAPIGGFLLGFGAIWSLLFARVGLSCGVDCGSPDLTPWLAIGLSAVAVGAVLSIVGQGAGRGTNGSSAEATAANSGEA